MLAASALNRVKDALAVAIAHGWGKGGLTGRAACVVTGRVNVAPALVVIPVVVPVAAGRHVAVVRGVVRAARWRWRPRCHTQLHRPEPRATLRLAQGGIAIKAAAEPRSGRRQTLAIQERCEESAAGWRAGVRRVASAGHGQACGVAEGRRQPVVALQVVAWKKRPHGGDAMGPHWDV